MKVVSLCVENISTLLFLARESCVHTSYRLSCNIPSSHLEVPSFEGDVWVRLLAIAPLGTGEEAGEQACRERSRTGAEEKFLSSAPFSVPLVPNPQSPIQL
ncbi:MAG: hypothetical protein RM347_003925 [Nostoc sp. ChiQUE02]|uniref:hypothetical protein n=1 Tax=Nostoc sp. ChiQUE02 TaxID=3075377 RepID=UPI002AD47727|nr:hypothetical protein [Nostoc sp. ChiQUE02]MDZ8232039.1 hypothetical protein [Nostoc sp. ChiQUE02]